MVDFLVSQGVKLRRVAYYPDYYDDRPGGSAPGRTVVAELFNANELPAPWAKKLRPNFISFAGALDELFVMATYTKSWAGKAMVAKVLLRGLTAKLTGKHWVAAGAALQGRMLQQAVARQVDLRINAPVKNFITQDGAVKGVVATVDGKERRFGANLGVLVNAGGFAQNQEMRDKYIPHTSAKWTATIPGDTGEMIRELIAQGAAIAQMGEMVGFQTAIPPGSENTGDGVKLGAIGGQTEIAKPHAILVDQTAVRYMNESGSYMEFCSNMRKRHEKVPAIPSWWIMDSQYMKNYPFCGTRPGTKKPQAWYDAGWLKTADTIEDLAKACNLDPATLKATIERFNTDVRAGEDKEFHRGERAYDQWLGDPFRGGGRTGNGKVNGKEARYASLGTIEEGPFYAAPMVPGDVGSYGGVVTDANARVLREDGTPIPGLYATGTSTASVMGSYYPGAGSSLGPSFTWGYVAAKHAAHASNVAG
jgi:3-oxosteroid 1-dehydrogenase